MFVSSYSKMASSAQLGSFSLVKRPSGPRAAAGTSYREAAPRAVVEYGRILGLGPNASKGEVKAAYRKLALQCHPDVCKGDECEVNFMEVNRAYESLMAHQSPQGYCFSNYAGESASYDGFGAPAPASAAQDDDPWADFLQGLGVASDEDLQVDYSSYYSNLKCYSGSKARRSKNSYPGASQYYQGNW